VTKKQYLSRLRATALAGERQSMYHSNTCAQAVPDGQRTRARFVGPGRLI
jgi:hypothetical protein